MKAKRESGRLNGVCKGCIKGGVQEVEGSLYITLTLYQHRPAGATNRVRRSRDSRGTSQLMSHKKEIKTSDDSGI